MGLYSAENGKKIVGLTDVESGKKIRGIIAIEDENSRVIYRSTKITPVKQWAYTVTKKNATKIDAMCEFKGDKTLFISANGKLLKISQNGELLKEFTPGVSISSLASTENAMFADYSNYPAGVIARIDPNTGAFLWTLNMSASYILKAGKNDTLFATSEVASSNPEIYKISSEGGIIWTIELPDSSGSLTSLESDSFGNVFVKFTNSKFYKISADGEGITEIVLKDASRACITESDFFYIGVLGLYRLKENGVSEYLHGTPIFINDLIPSGTGVLCLVPHPWHCIKYDKFGNQVYQFDFSEQAAGDTTVIAESSTGFYITKKIDAENSQVIKVIEEEG